MTIVRMTRREFVAALGCAPGAWPVMARGQQTGVRRIGILVLGNADPASFMKYFREELARLGYIEGKNIAFEYRSAEGDASLLPKLAAELVKLKVEVIVAWQTPPSLAAKNATAEIPIVMADSGDPVANGLVASLAHPGGNVTGMTGQTDELAAKNIELIREMLPQARRIGVLGNATDAFTNPFLSQIENAAKVKGIDAEPLIIRGKEDFGSALSYFAKTAIDAVMVQPSLAARRAAELAVIHHLPAVSISRWFVEEGGLMSYSANLSHLYQRAAWHLDKILKGTNPSELPVEQPTNFELFINLKTAQALGLEIPPSLLARADEVIE